MSRERFVLSSVLLAVLVAGCSTPLGSAVERGDINRISALLDRGMDVNAKEACGWSGSDSILNGATPLICAAATGNIKIARLLLERGADLNATSSWWHLTALDAAVRHNHVQMVQFLLERGAQVNDNPTQHSCDGSGRICASLEWAKRSGFTKIVRLLEQAQERELAELGVSSSPVPGPATPPASSAGPQQPPPLRPQAMAVPQAPTPESPRPALGRVPAVDFGRYHALVIGNNRYRHVAPLETAVADATAVAQVLREQYGFTVTLLTDATRDQILDALNQLRATLTERDNALLYYAGHGVRDEAAERGYWLPVDAEGDKTTHWVSTVEVTDTLKAMTAKHVLVVADSCYAGTLARGVGVSAPKTGEDPAAYVTRLAAKRSRTALLAGGLEPVLDRSGRTGHSVFAQAFLTALQENAGVLEGEGLFLGLRRAVVVNAPQTPEYVDIRFAGHEGGDFLFVRR